MLNTVILMGRITRNPVLRYTNSNVAVMSFTIAVDRDGKDSGTDFFDCVAWRKTAEFIDTYFFKGSMIAVVGVLRIREWKDKDGANRKTTEVIVDRAYFCGGRLADEEAGHAAGEQLGEQISEEDDGDIPF